MEHSERSWLKSLHYSAGMIVTRSRCAEAIYCDGCAAFGVREVADSVCIAARAVKRSKSSCTIDVSKEERLSFYHGCDDVHTRRQMWTYGTPSLLHHRVEGHAPGMLLVVHHDVDERRYEVHQDGAPIANLVTIDLAAPRCAAVH